MYPTASSVELDSRLACPFPEKINKRLYVNNKIECKVSTVRTIPLLFFIIKIKLITIITKSTMTAKRAAAMGTPISKRQVHVHVKTIIT